MTNTEATAKIISWTRTAATADLDTLATTSPKAGLDYSHIRPLIEYINASPITAFAYRMGLELLNARLDDEAEDTEAFYGLIVSAAHGFDGIPLAVYEACGTWTELQGRF